MTIFKNLYDANDTIEVKCLQLLPNMPEIAAVYSPSGCGLCCDCATGCEFCETDDDDGGWHFERPDNVACECENCGVRVATRIEENKRNQLAKDKQAIATNCDNHQARCFERVIRRLGLMATPTANELNRAVCAVQCEYEMEFGGSVDGQTLAVNVFEWYGIDPRFIV